MNRTFIVAIREYIATVATKGFMLGVLLPPVIMLAVFPLMQVLMNQKSPKVTGTIAVIDHSGVVAPKLAKAFEPDAQRERQKAKIERRKQAMGSVNVPVAGLDPEQMRKQQEAAVEMMTVESDIRLEPLPPTSDVEKEKEAILASVGREKDLDGTDKRLALLVVPAEAVKGGADGKYTPYQSFVAPKLDAEVQGDIEREARRAIIDARLEGANFDSKQIRTLMAEPEAKSVAVTKDGDRGTNRMAAIFVPMGFMMLLWISVFTAGQYLLTSLIEEKSSRVMELLLSAVSPLQLMVGKIVGQLGVGLTILGLYAGAGLATLIVFKQAHLLDPVMLGYLAIYFIIAFFTVAALMAAIGSAVSDIREAQSLMAPVMIVLMVPMMLWLPIQRNPNSIFAQVCSFLPPLSPFAMILRLSGSEKVPFWQVPASIAVGIGSVVVLCWAAAKIFRVGVLMYGKPPSLLGLIKWIKYA
ncbi:MAG: ABC transporter permease [Planctomycetes bacterium]|nr:ABC transporter permease [Planctomycetota bacterium]